MVSDFAFLVKFLSIVSDVDFQCYVDLLVEALAKVPAKRPVPSYP